MAPMSVTILPDAKAGGAPSAYFAFNANAQRRQRRKEYESFLLRAFARLCVFALKREASNCSEHRRMPSQSRRYPSLTLRVCIWVLAAISAVPIGAAERADQILTIKKATIGFAGKFKAGFWQPVRLTIV